MIDHEDDVVAGMAVSYSGNWNILFGRERDRGGQRERSRQVDCSEVSVWVCVCVVLWVVQLL